MNIIGMALEDLSIQLNCHIQQISTALSVRTVVNFLSGVLATFTIHYFNRQLQLIFYLVLYALSSGVIPFIHSIWPFFAQSVFSGKRSFHSVKFTDLSIHNCSYSYLTVHD